MRVEADLVADQIAHLLVLLEGDALGKVLGGDSPGLGADYFHVEPGFFSVLVDVLDDLGAFAWG